MDDSQLLPALETLALKLRRPAGSLAALAYLTPVQIAELDAAIDAACTRQRQEIDTRLRRLLPGPLRALLRGAAARAP